MRRIVLTSPKIFSIQEIEQPALEPGQALVKVRKVGICGSDVHLYREGRIGDVNIEEPFVMGHECMGEVMDVGAGVNRDLVGARVAVEPAIPCGRCGWCNNGKQNLCPDVLFLGLPPKQGALQEYIAHPAYLLEKVPDSMDDESATMLEPMAIALHAINLVKVAHGQSVVILGTGVIGTCVLSLLKQYENLRIICVDPIQDRLERAAEMGAETIRPDHDDYKNAVSDRIKSAAGGMGAHVVFECSGEPETMWNMCEVAAPGAHVAVIGISPGERIILSSHNARRKGLTLRFLRRSLNTLTPCVRMAQEGLITPGDLVTHVFSAGDVSQAFETVDNYADGVLKAIVDMEGE